MKYFLDVEFLEGKQKVKLPFTNIDLFDTKPTIDLISIGITNTYNVSYYAISKDFNLREAWNRYDISGDNKTFWIRDKILKPIFDELLERKLTENPELLITIDFSSPYSFTYKNLRALINYYGKTNNQIKEDIKEFVTDLEGFPKFYTYYGAYDWIVFCWLFGEMANFLDRKRQYNIDLRQELDRVIEDNRLLLTNRYNSRITENEAFQDLKTVVGGYPPANLNYDTVPVTRIHSALHESRFNKDLFNFIRKCDRYTQLEKQKYNYHIDKRRSGNTTRLINLVVELLFDKQTVVIVTKDNGLRKARYENTFVVENQLEVVRIKRVIFGRLEREHGLHFMGDINNELINISYFNNRKQIKK